MKKYKFIHIFWGEDTKFTPSLVKAINDPEGHFEINDHLFVTRYSSLFDYLSEYNNIVLDTSDDCLINKYAPYCDCLFSHGLPSNKELIRIKNKYKKKIIARTWGGNRIIKRYSNNFIKNIKIFLYNSLVKINFNLRYGSFAGIGIANVVDVVDLRKINKKIPLCILNYDDKDIDYDWLVKLKNSYQRENDKIRILVGHRGTIGENHYKIMELLKKYEQYNIEIILILSYGDNAYIEDLIRRVSTLWSQKVKIIKKFMPIKDYYILLNSVDIAIFDEERSSALGNISAMLSLNKKIFLNENGVIREGFDKEEIPYCLTKDIECMSFEDFINPVDYSNCIVESLYVPFDKRISKYYYDLHKTFDFAGSL